MNGKSTPLYKRQRFLLALAQIIGVPASATDFQKIMFLCMMHTERNDYEFVPYRYGPYSFQLAEDINALVRMGFLIDVAHKIKAAHPDSESDYKIDFSVPSERGDALIRKTYRAYPYYTIRSEILQRLFYNSPEELQQLYREREVLRKKDSILFTIGYEGRTLEAFLNVLLKNDVRVLCDVRKNPFSRKFGFSKEKLEQATQGIKVKYADFSTLGIESDKRKELDTVDDYNILFANYQKTLPSREKELHRLYSIFQEDGRIALMCFEKEPQMCHRHVIRDYLCSTYPIRSVDL